MRPINKVIPCAAAITPALPALGPGPARARAADDPIRAAVSDPSRPAANIQSRKP